jgi:3-oxoacyl-[acyl-carrier-protein] synthase I
MEKTIYISLASIHTPLGETISENISNLKKAVSGIKLYKEVGYKKEDLFLAKIDSLKGNRFQDLIHKICVDLKKSISTEVLLSEKTICLISSTKGDISAFPDDTFTEAKTKIQNHLELKNKILLISNACISGVVAINTGAEYLKNDIYEHAIIIGVDTISDFINFGFQSLFAVGNSACKPFDSKRNGISIGEAGVAVLLSKNHKESGVYTARYLAGSSSNDANHISGPSRSGEGLVRTVNKSLTRAKLAAVEIDYVSAHGTATVFNDEMESIAFNRLDLQNVPLNSLKGYFGHTFGAAGVLETAFCIVSLVENFLFKSLGFEYEGTTEKLAILTKNKQTEVKTILKTASGFGGGNASLILTKASVL